MWLFATEGLIMWFLLIILLASAPSLDRTTVLNRFATYEECKPERDRIGFEMAESYPHENDFHIVCEFREITAPQSPLVHSHSIHYVWNALWACRAALLDTHDPVASRFRLFPNFLAARFRCIAPSSSPHVTKHT